jgi:tetratricopeptide (TPR) repeat protein
MLLIIAVAMTGCGATKNFTSGISYESGLKKFEARQLDEAIVIFQEIADSESAYASRARFYLGESYKLQFKWEEADAEYQKVAASESPTSYLAAESRNRISQIREGKRDTERIKIIHDNQRESNPEAAANALLELGSVYENKLDDYDNAIAAYRQLIEEFPGTPKAAQAQVNIGNIFFYKKYDYVGGWPEFKKVNVENYPTLTYRVGEVESLLREVNKVQEEITEETQFIKRSQKRIIPTDGRTYTGYDIYGVLEEQVAQSFVAVATKWRKLKNYPKALEAYQMQIERLPLILVQTSESRYGIAEIYQEQGLYFDAVDAYNEFIKYHPTYFRREQAVYNTAICYEALRDYEEAYENYKTYAMTYPDEKFYKAAELKVRQFEYDEDQDGFPYYKEATAGTSDTDANAHP